MRGIWWFCSLLVRYTQVEFIYRGRDRFFLFLYLVLEATVQNNLDERRKLLERCVFLTGIIISVTIALEIVTQLVTIA